MGLQSFDQDRQTAKELTAGMTYVVIPAQFKGEIRAKRSRSARYTTQLVRWEIASPNPLVMTVQTV